MKLQMKVQILTFEPFILAFITEISGITDKLINYMGKNYDGSTKWYKLREQVSARGCKVPV